MRLERQLNLYAAAAGVIKSRNQIDQRTLAHAGASDKANHFTGLHFEINSEDLGQPILAKTGKHAYVENKPV